MTDKDNEPTNSGGFGMHANKSEAPAEPAAPAPEENTAQAEEANPVPEAPAEPAPAEVAPTEAPSADAAPTFPEEDKPKLDNLPPEDIYGSDSQAEDSAHL